MESQLDFAQAAVVGIDRHLRIERAGTRNGHGTVELIGAGRDFEWNLLLRTEAAILSSAPGETDDFDGLPRVVINGDDKLYFLPRAGIG